MRLVLWNKNLSTLVITVKFVTVIIPFSLFFSYTISEAEINIPGDIVPGGKNPVIKLTDRGIVPPMLKIKGEEGIVFFLNETSNSEIRLELDFGDKRTHCGGTNMRIGDDGKIASSRPLGPRDFATTCFHDRGSYKFKVFGLKANPKGIESTITLE